MNYLYNQNVRTLLAHFRCCPGTEREVTNMVKHRSRNTVPIREQRRRNKMDLRHMEYGF